MHICATFCSSFCNFVCSFITYLFSPVDEFQNLNFHELDSIITRVGENSRILFCGDARQSDLTKTNDRNGIVDFLNILRKMSSFDIIEFGIDDIVRSGLVKEYLTAKIELGM